MMAKDAPGAEHDRAYTRVIWLIAGGTFFFAFGQAVWAVSAGSAQFLKDAIDWIYTVLLYGIAAVAFGRGAKVERLFALVIAAILATAGAHTLYDLWSKIADPRPIDPELLGFSAASAILIGYATAGALLRFRHDRNPLIKATWLSARNDAISTTVSAVVTLTVRLAPVRWPEYVVDVLNAGLAFQAAYVAARVSRSHPQDRPRSRHGIRPKRTP